jgi:hypothetical protein
LLKSPQSSPYRKLKEGMQKKHRDFAHEMMKNKLFTVKTSIQQTRFSHTDLIDLKNRFEKNSTWVLVNEDGSCLTRQTEGKDSDTTPTNKAKR